MRRSGGWWVCDALRLTDQLPLKYADALNRCRRCWDARLVGERTNQRVCIDIPSMWSAESLDSTRRAREKTSENNAQRQNYNSNSSSSFSPADEEVKGNIQNGTPARLGLTSHWLENYLALLRWMTAMLVLLRLPACTSSTVTRVERPWTSEWSNKTLIFGIDSNVGLIRSCNSTNVLVHVGCIIFFFSCLLMSTED